MAYILKSRRVKRGMPLGDDTPGGFLDSITSAISDAGTAISNIPLTTGSGTVGSLVSADSAAIDAGYKPPGAASSSSGSGVADVIGAIFGSLTKSGLPTAPTVIYQKPAGMSPTTMIALAVGGVALVALLARRSS